MKKNFSILILSDAKAGHLNQSKAIAGIIEKRKIDQGMSVEEVQIKTAEVKFRNRAFRSLLAVCSIFSVPRCRSCLGCLRFCLNKNSFKELMQLPADIVISCGSSISSVNLFLSYKNNARSIVLMKPSFLSLNKFDLVIAPEHDRIKPKDNVLLTRTAPNLIDRAYLEEQARILNTKYDIRYTKYENNGPTIGVLIGGDSPKYRLTGEMMQKIISQLKRAVQNLNCQILVTSSRRTPEAVEKLLKENLAHFPSCKLLVIANEKNIPEAVGGILGLSNIVVVSGESISMVSEAISAGKYVLVFKPGKKFSASTKQERFLENLEQKKLLKVIGVDNLAFELERIWKNKPKKAEIRDQELIYQALGRII